jgi:hypothetical protein
VTLRTSRHRAFGRGSSPRFREAAMYDPHHFTQLNTIFGSGYVAEQHAAEARRHLPPPEHHEFVVNVDELLNTLRAALSLR